MFPGISPRIDLTSKIINIKDILIKLILSPLYYGDRMRKNIFNKCKQVMENFVVQLIGKALVLEFLKKNILNI
jgi:hypothetical protein